MLAPSDTPLTAFRAIFVSPTVAAAAASFDAVDVVLFAKFNVMPLSHAVEHVFEHDNNVALVAAEHVS